jgi:O-antigen/teichoic acid export membrane protein
MLLGNVAYALGHWLQLMILARAGGPEAVGAYAYALALTAPPIGLANLQLRALLASDARGSHTFREYLLLRVVTTGLAVLGIVLVASGLDGGPGLLPVLVPVCVLRAAEALSDIYYGWWQRRERMALIGWGLAASGAGSAALMGVASMLGGGVAWAAGGAALGSCAALAFVHLRTAGAERLERGAEPPAPIAYRRLLRLAAQASPLGAITLLGSLQANVPRYFIRLSTDEATLGLFAAASQLPGAGGVVVGALGSAAVPRLASLCEKGDGSSFRALIRKLVLAAALLGGAGVALSALVGRQVLTFLYRPEFATADGMLVVLSLAAGIGFVASLYGYALTSARVINIQPVLLAVVIAVLAAGCAALVPRFGGVGAAWAIVAGAAVQALASAAALRLSHAGRTPAGVDSTVKSA